MSRSPITTDTPISGPDPIDVHVGERIRAHRRLAGLSQAQLGEEIGVSFQQIQKYERGTNRISASMLCRASTVLKCRPSDLLPEFNKTGESLGVDAAYSLLSMPNGVAVVKALRRLPTWAYESAVRLILDIDANIRGRSDG